ncbi:MAG: hypothetical protein HRF43_04475 [Phycisphaerae bacterium]|jgi:hypothetical protein
MPLVSLMFVAVTLPAEAPATQPVGGPGREALWSGTFRWRCGPPLIAPADRPADPCHAIKDPSIVRFDGRWHVFCTIRSRTRTHQIEYLSFPDFDQTARARRHVLTCHDGFFCAPQVFYFTPQKRWYLIYQAVLEQGAGMFPAFSTTTDVSDPGSWSRPAVLTDRKPEGGRWIDFWVICDRRRAYLFFTSLDGRMWRAQTDLGQFPRGWSKPELALRGDIFEAAHVYSLKGMKQYLAVIEAQDGGRRYYKAYLADALEGPWRPLADSRRKPFASPLNVIDSGEHWTDSISHGELLRAGHDEHLEVDPNHLTFLFQGVSDKDRVGKPYGDIPWRLGLLEAIP